MWLNVMNNEEQWGTEGIFVSNSTQMQWNKRKNTQKWFANLDLRSNKAENWQKTMGNQKNREKSFLVCQKEDGAKGVE